MPSPRAISASPAGFEVIAVSPVTPRVPRTTSLSSPVPARRRVTPTLEGSASRNTFLIVSRDTFTSQSDTVNLSLPSLSSIPKCLFQSDVAHIDARWPLNLPREHSATSRQAIQLNPLNPANQEAMQNTSLLDPLLQTLRPVELPRHIILPFDLRVTPRAWAENSDILTGIFSNCSGIAFDGYFLLYSFTTLPPNPWPKTIAGVPCHFSLGFFTDDHLPSGKPAYTANPQISKDVDGRNLANWDSVFDLMRNHFDKLGIAITEIQYWDTYVVIVLEIEVVDFRKIPKVIANLRCLYLYEKEMGRPEALRARRQHELALGNADETKYSILRPGVRVAFSLNPYKPGEYLSTTAGILVKDRIGNVFMTTASHGFTSVCGTAVYQPTPIGGVQSIGELIMKVSYTDIALVKLKDDVTFENITFHGDILTEPMRLDRFAITEDRPKHGIIHLDSPDTGYIEGLFRFSSRQRIPDGDLLQPKQQWLFTTWYYLGQDGSQNLPDGMCGSAIWDGDGSVLGLFWYAPKAGVMKDWCAGIAADELVKRGYTVVAPPMI